MPRELFVWILPSLIPTGALRGGTAVIIDLLRASTTITHALAAGAARVIPVLTIEDARRAAAAHTDPRALLAGERAGVRIDGFDLGNSPAEFTPESVGGRTVIFTTTNGTKAIFACRDAERVLIGCFANISALEAEASTESAVHLVCAGTDGAPTLEDTLFAGAMAARLAARGFTIANDQAHIAMDVWSAASRDTAMLAAALHKSRGGRNLASIDLGADVDECARIDTRNVVAELRGEHLLPVHSH